MFRLKYQARQFSRGMVRYCFWFRIGFKSSLVKVNFQCQVFLFLIGQVSGLRWVDLLWFLFYRQRGYDVFSRQLYQFRFFDGINFNFFGKFKNFCEERQEGGKVRKIGRGQMERRKKIIFSFVRCIGLCFIFC